MVFAGDTSPAHLAAFASSLGRAIDAVAELASRTEFAILVLRNKLLSLAHLSGIRGPPKSGDVRFVSDSVNAGIA